MKSHGKKYTAARKQVPEKPCTLDEAIPLVRKIKYAGFDETMELALLLGVDPKHADQMVRGTVILPHGTGGSKKVLVIASGEKMKEAEKAGADHVGGPDMVQKIQEGWLDFDAIVATPDMMKDVGKLGKILGPKGLMPNPKLGTVTPNVAEAVKAAKGGQVEFRAEKAGIIHAGIGKVSFDEDKLLENAKALADAVIRAKPTGAKGTYLKGVAVSSTMGPGVKVDISTLG